MVNRWGNSGNSHRLYFWGLQNYCGWWLQPWNLKMLTPWKDNYDQLRQHIKKQRHYFANKGLSSQGYGFPVVVYGCKNWTVKKAECQRFDAFELWCWRRLLRVPWTAKRSNQFILKEISPACSSDWCWSRISNTLATWCEELTHLKRPWCWEGLGAGGERDDRGWDDWMASPSQWAWVWAISGRQIVKDRGAWHVAVHGVTKHQTQFNTTSLLVKILSCILPVWN